MYFNSDSNLLFSCLTSCLTTKVALYMPFLQSSHWKCSINTTCITHMNMNVAFSSFKSETSI